MEKLDYRQLPLQGMDGGVDPREVIINKINEIIDKLEELEQ